MTYQTLNKENIASLRKLINRQDKPVAAFVGAGSSKVPGLPDWTDLLIRMHETLNPGDTSIDVSQCILVDGYPKTATKIYAINSNIEQYRAFMSKQFQPKAARYHSLHINILNVFDHIYTTNYDACFEAAIEDINTYLIKHAMEPVVIDVLKLGPEIRALPANSSLIYLHGNNELNDYVLRDEDYDSNYALSRSLDSIPSKLEAFLRMVLEDITLLFIGFSFEDVDFKNYYHLVKSSLRKKSVTGENYSDYIVVAQETYEKDKDMLKDLALKPIVFEGNNYLKIETILKEISTPETDVADISEADNV